MIRHPIFCGEEQVGAAGERIVSNPYDSSEVGRVTYANVSQAQDAARFAKETFKQQKLPSSERAVIRRSLLPSEEPSLHP
jgi:delta 1-pyrroline-5-carboxylate dehydrogenase